MQSYLLLMIAAAWHALGIGTHGHRGRIVHTITAVGMLWGALTPPWGWVQIGGAVATVVTARWLTTGDGRAFVSALGRVLVETADGMLRLLGRTFRWVLSPGVHEAPPVEQSAPVSTPRWTGGSRMASTPPAHLLVPDGRKRHTAHNTGATPTVAPEHDYGDVIGSVAAGALRFGEGWGYVERNFGVSRSKYAVDVRKIRRQMEEQPA